MKCLDLSKDVFAEDERLDYLCGWCERRKTLVIIINDLYNNIMFICDSNDWYLNNDRIHSHTAGGGKAAWRW